MATNKAYRHLGLKPKRDSGAGSEEPSALF